MKARKLPKEENYGTSNQSETPNELHNLSETIILNGSEDEQDNETTNHHIKMINSSSEASVDNKNDLTVSNSTRAKSISTMPSKITLPENETRRAASEVPTMKDRNTEHLDSEKPAITSSRDDTRESRKRKGKQVKYVENFDRNRWLCAVNGKGREVKVMILISNRPYVGDRSTSENRSAESSNDLGNDGNQHFCQVCRGFGDVVCCDGCPRVYHQKCIPVQSTSRIALEDRKSTRLNSSHSIASRMPSSA